MVQNLGLLALWMAHFTAEPALVGGRSGECEINVRLDFAGKKPPVILAKNPAGRYELAKPTIRSSQNSYISLKDKRILISCPGKQNSLNLGDSNKIMDAESSCMYNKGHNYFKIEGKEYHTDQVQCAKRVTPIEFMTQEHCNGDGHLLKLGYMIDNEFYDLIQVCHRLKDGMTYYSRHILDGSHFSRTGNISNRPDNGRRPRFSYQNKALYRGFPPYKYYKAAVQQKLLTQITGNPEVFDNKHEKFFAKGHLSPNADYLLNTWRDVTFLFVNAQPQWQEINGKNWAEIEKAVRNHAIKTGEKYEIVTGTQGVLTLNSTKLYLDSKSQRLPVPERFIKVVREIESDKCVAFIANNFPLGEPPMHKCEDVCLQYSWPDLKDYKKAGYVYCCSYEELRTAFPKSFPRVECTGGTLKNDDSTGLSSTTNSSGLSSTTDSSGLSSTTDSSGLSSTTDSSGLSSTNSLFSDSISKRNKMLLIILATASWMVNFI